MSAASLLHPGELTRRPSRALVTGAGAVVLVGLLAGVLDRNAPAGVAALCGGVVVLAGLRLPGTSALGWLVGAYLFGVNAVGWTLLAPRLPVWALNVAFLAVLGALALQRRRALVVPWRAGALWTGPAVLAVSTVASIAAAELSAAGQRGIYAAIAVLLVVLLRDRPAAHSLGVVAAFLTGLGLLLVAGSGTVFEDAHHVTPRADLVAGMTSRFWGGPLLTLHPNMIAMFAWVVLARLVLDRQVALVTRCLSWALCLGLLALTTGRTALLAYAMVLVVCLVVLVRDRAHVLFPGRALSAAVLVAATAAVVGLAYLDLDRDARTDSRVATDPAAPSVNQRSTAIAGDRSSGRTATWRVVVGQFTSAGPAEQALGSGVDGRGRVVQPGNDVPVPVDNVPLAVLHRAGVVGVAAFAVGSLLVLLHVARRTAPAWAVACVAAAAMTSLTEELLLGGVVWVLVLLAEAGAQDAGTGGAAAGGRTA